ncbi:uncharacterized protein LOC122195309 [Lactuca sativa]|uniref:uncharacterized protein LOC122195309 n=1 Tax=Lactuca sativa TaxID=4236 RepID=UPI001C687A6D|nr:uncharacterized protein LOC122195309 [Lactuca sativa]
MYSHYLDALSICRIYGNPQYFITFTCNVKLLEITRYMDAHHQTDPHSRADIIARVFNIKVHDFIRFLKEDKTFGVVEAYLYTIEFQKRGLPHCHTLVWVSASDRIKIGSDVDRYITAELPDPVNEAELYETITSCMIHGPCGPLNQKAPCMKDGKCSKHFPKPFLPATFLTQMDMYGTNVAQLRTTLANMDRLLTMDILCPTTKGFVHDSVHILMLSTVAGA